MPKNGTLVITIENGDISALEDALPFNEGMEVSKRSESKYQSFLCSDLTFLAEAQIVYELETQDLEILQSALEDNGFEITATEEKNPDDEIYENLKKQTEKMFLDDDEEKKNVRFDFYLVINS
jgi:hypothetical protein